MRIKINTNNGTTDKLIAVSCQLSALRKLKSRFLKLKANSYKLKAILSAFRNLPPTTYHLQPSPHNLKPNRGFTLVELLVTLSLFVVITTIVLFSQSKFNGSILLTNLAYDIAITIRQAQTFGVNVREASGGSFKHAYGVHFNKDNTTEFILFADIDDNYKYDGGSDCAESSECVNKYNIKRGNKISKICVTFGGADYCSDLSALSKLDITFLRPDPDAIIKGDNYSDAAEAKITILSADGNTRNIVVNSTGQISIQRN
ncbi:MAG: prepilin-type N-terminal cleavage/methylation domain-containing protein [Patescibacteria group bacterium]